jgi:hypothetical protein
VRGCIVVSNADRVDAEWTGETTDDLFLDGLDTNDIARKRWMKEAEVLRQITVQRCERRGLASPYAEGGTQ